VLAVSEQAASDRASGRPRPRDPFALGLDATVSATEPLDADLESMRARLARALAVQSPPAVPLPSAPAEPPTGAIVAANGRPFTDRDAAQFKAARLLAETGEPFDVVPVADGFIVVTTPLPGNRERADRGDAPVSPSPSPPARRRNLLEPEGLTLDDFPKDHPVHRFGAPGVRRYQRMLKKNYVLKQAYRSQAPLLVLACVGVLVALVPDPFLRLVLPPESNEAMATLIPAEHVSLVVSALAALFALFAFGKIVWMRLFYRYRLLPNYAKSEAGIIARKTKKMVYTSILTTDVHQSVIGRLLNFGSIELSCAGGDHADIMIDNVFWPELVQSLVEARVWEAKQRLSTGVPG
jgi:membrane protein YdbS with pleckstrin-like domain